jgi:hypothetical protein
MNLQQKNSALVIGFLVMLLVAYSFSIRKTFELKKSLNELRKEKEVMFNAEEQLFKLQNENGQLDAVLLKNDLSIENSFQQTLLQKINSFSMNKNCEIIAFNEPHSYISADANLMTYIFELKGNFNELVSFTNYIERQRLGTVQGIHFLKKKNYRKNREELIGTFYIQKLNN